VNTLCPCVWNKWSWSHMRGVFNFGRKNGYDTIPLEIFIGIVYGPPTDTYPVWGIMWNTCTWEMWDPNRPYDIIAKGCHTWHVCGHTYVVLVRFIPMQDWLLIQISTTLLDMSDTLFNAPTHRNACFILWWWIKRCLINDDYIDILTLQLWLFNWMV
jgi:hypothetical protein